MAVELLAASRPVSWVNTALPFAAAAYAVDQRWTPAILLGTVLFLFPYNLLLYGVNDLHDYASDVANPRKGGLEGALVPPTSGRVLWAAVLLTNVPLIAAVAWLAGPLAGALLVLTALVAWAYSAPPLRTKERPFLDSITSALHFALPAVCGFVVAGAALDQVPWAVVVAFVAWGVASHAIGAVQDIAYDRAAGIGSIATAIGARSTGLVALAGYGLAVLLVAIQGPAGLFAAAWLALYLVLAAMVVVRPGERQARRAWRSFMGLNIVVGFVLAQQLLRAWDITDWTPSQLVASLVLIPTAWVTANALLTLLLVPVVSRPAAGAHDGLHGWQLRSDAWTVLDPAARAALAAAARDREADLVSAITRLVGRDARSLALAGGFATLLHGFVPLWVAPLLRRPRRRATWAWGPAAVAGPRALDEGLVPPAPTALSTAEATALARELVRQGGRSILLRGPWVGRTSRTPSLVEARRAWSTELLASAGDSFAPALLAILGWLLAWALPPLVMIAGAIAGDPVVLVGGLVATGLLVVARGLVARLGDEPLVGALLRHPLTAVLTPPLQVAGLAAALLRPPAQGTSGGHDSTERQA